jgi:hypothetical protein
MEMIILIKKGVFTQQQLFMVISVLKIKGKLITCKIIYIVFVTKCIVSGRIFSPLLDILKASYQQF